jgi:F-type H+-transporting ATPase subunit delta
MQDHKVARRYASALFQAAQAGDAVQPVEADMATIAGHVRDNPEFRDFLISPHTGRDEKVRILQKIFSSSFQPVSMQLVKILIEKRRENEIVGLYDEYVTLRRAHDRVAHAIVTSADPLDDAQRAKVVAKLGTMLNKRIEPEFQVDSAIVGGVRVQYENTIFDGSVKGALDKLKDRLRHDVLKQA